MMIKNVTDMRIFSDAAMQKNEMYDLDLEIRAQADASSPTNNSQPISTAKCYIVSVYYCTPMCAPKR